jgi:hypothetical protein
VYKNIDSVMVLNEVEENGEILMEEGKEKVRPHNDDNFSRLLKHI